MTGRELVLEVKGQPNKTQEIGPVMITPPVGEDHWSWRVMLSSTQAIAGFPKFGTIGIGFAQEEDWNTNLPYTCDAQEIYDHIEHNKGDEAITREDCLTAIRMVQAAVRAGPAGDPVSPLAWVVVAYLATNCAGGITRAVLSYRASKRNAEIKAKATEVGK